MLTSFNGTAITYDAIGNPLSYYNGANYTFTWNGRRLATAVKGSNTMSFTYDDEGIRTSKTVNSVTTNYYYQGSLLYAEETNSQITIYIYDENGAPIGFMYRGADYDNGVWNVYAFEKNLQGDVVASGNLPFDYYLSPWEAEANILGQATFTSSKKRSWNSSDGKYNYIIDIFK